MRVRFHGGMHRCLHHACPERYQGRWICGLCVEAVKDEALRSVTHISTEEALERHISFCEKFRAWNPSDKTEHPIFAMGRILRRSLDSPRALRTKSSSVLPGHLLRSESCFSALERHISLLREVRAWNPSDKTEHPIFAMGRILRRSLDSPRALRTKSSSVLPGHLLDLKVVSQLFLSDLFLLKFKFKRGFNNPLKQKQVFARLGKLNVDIICLMETRVRTVNVCKLLIVIPWIGIVHKSRVFDNGRLLIFWRKYFFSTVPLEAAVRGGKLGGGVLLANRRVKAKRSQLEKMQLANLSQAGCHFVEEKIIFNELQELEVAEASFYKQKAKSIDAGVKSCGVDLLKSLLGYELPCAAVASLVEEGFFQSGTLLPAFNATSITLVPKTHNAGMAKDFRPISCCSVVYKTITGIIVKWLASYFPDMILPNQSAFIKGRSIVDNTLLAQEIVRGYSRRSLSLGIGFLHVSLVLDILWHLMAITGFNLGKFPVRYLGVPLVTRKLTAKDCLPLVDKIRIFPIMVQAVGSDVIRQVVWALKVWAAGTRIPYRVLCWDDTLVWAASNLKGKSLLVCILKLAWTSLLYFVWEERNLIHFRGCFRAIDEVFEVIKRTVSVKLHDCSVNKADRVNSQLCLDWNIG
ncbi:hypothetical protein F3Y22_tig00111238pilonHSYRG00266 [Hibiscus syriacus]|uniref:Uncharacterized protein n=1 Tax=Hibiscus syriacus TaxID=106335 RepID=A0A6A2YU36_HIBSY|nr:hypothetical protein F3Y22_tig00111238pilonHSYRG00266 [Hibiscus syriacus]